MKVLSETYSNSISFSGEMSSGRMLKRTNKKEIFTPCDNSSRSQYEIYDSEIKMLQGQNNESFLNTSHEESNCSNLFQNDNTFTASKVKGFSSALKPFCLDTGTNQNNSNHNHKQTQMTFTDLISHVNRSQLKKLCSPRNKPTKSFLSLYQEKIALLLSKSNSSSFIENQKLTFPNAEQVGLGIGKKRVLFFDLDKVLLQCFFGGDYSDSDDVIQIKMPSQISVKVGVTLRPSIRETLEQLKEDFFLCVYSTCDEILGDALINFIDFNQSLFTLRLYRDKCHKFKISNHYVYVKDLRIIQGVSPRDMLIIDTNSLSAGLQPNNVLPVTPFNTTKNNKNLSSLVIQLSQLALREDLRIGSDNCIPLRRKKASTLQLSKPLVSKYPIDP